MPPMLRSLALLALSLSPVALAGDISPDTAAKVTRERTKALEEVNQKYGNKKSSELSSEERRQMIKDQAEAVAKVLDKNGVDAKDFAHYEAKASKEDRAAAAASGKAMDQKEADDKKAADEKKKAKSVETSNGVIIERGIDPKDLPPGGPPAQKGGKGGHR